MGPRTLTSVAVSIAALASSCGDPPAENASSLDTVLIFYEVEGTVWDLGLFSDSTETFQLGGLWPSGLAVDDWVTLDDAAPDPDWGTAVVINAMNWEVPDPINLESFLKSDYEGSRVKYYNTSDDTRTFFQTTCVDDETWLEVRINPRWVDVFEEGTRLSDTVELVVNAEVFDFSETFGGASCDSWRLGTDSGFYDIVESDGYQSRVEVDVPDRRPGWDKIVFGEIFEQKFSPSLDGSARAEFTLRIQTARILWNHMQPGCQPTAPFELCTTVVEGLPVITATVPVSE